MLNTIKTFADGDSGLVAFAVLMGFILVCVIIDRVNEYKRRLRYLLIQKDESNAYHHVSRIHKKVFCMKIRMKRQLSRLLEM